MNTVARFCDVSYYDDILWKYHTLT